MIGVSADVITHKLNVDPDNLPVKQKRRKFAPERNRIINEEIQKLLDIGFVREVHCPQWLANIVVVPKKNGKWRVCIDFIDLNKACPKDSFPLPHIDMMVDATAGHELLSFMDAFSGYNQILMHPEDQEKTSFITERGTYCYKVMPFGLKNAGATYQRLVNKIFTEYLGKSMEVYIDDMLVKSLRAEDHVNHLRQSFKVLQQNGMKLNPTKCTFGVRSGKFLGYLVTQRGVEANQDQIKSIMDIPSPRTKKDVQKLTGIIAVLSRFISRSSDRCQKFFDILRKNKTFQWTPECDRALQELKEYLTQPPLLSKPLEGEILYLYLSVSVSAVLVREEERKQKPIYYTSKALLDAETSYTHLEKLALALVVAARKLRPYFQCHPIVVPTTFPMKSILHKPELSGRLAKWAVELGEHDITFQPRTTIKSQVLADFVADFSPSIQKEAEGEAMCLDKETYNDGWTMHVDGSSTTHDSGLGVSLRSPQGDVFEQSYKCGFKATNNESEYEVLIAVLGLAISMGIDSIIVYSDSQLVVNQMQGDYQVRDSKLIAYMTKAKEIQLSFKRCDIKQIPRDQNVQADALANLGSSIEATEEKKIMLVYLEWPAVWKGHQEALDVQQTRSWMDPIIDYLREDKLPENKMEACKLRVKAARFSIIEGTLYRRSYTGVLLRCLTPEEAKHVLQELHEGECGNHSGPRSLAHRALTVGYYWPTMRADTKDYVRTCDKCQRYAPVPHQPSEPLHPIISPWPFMKWGMDIVGKLPMAPGQKVYLLMVTDYFTKWVEGESFSCIKDKEVINFIWKNVICRFGVPKEIVTDNGSQFINVSTLKKRLEAAKGKWVKEFPAVLWSYRTTEKTSTGETPFSLTYGFKAVLPVERGLDTLRKSTANEETNSNQMAKELDLLDEKRDKANLRIASYKQMVARHYNKNLRTRAYKVGDYVLRRTFQNTKEAGVGKLGSNWEGPYQITKVVGQGAYKLQATDGRNVTNSWNACHLRPYFY
ncbi:uncharacterized protein LOC133795468 [Humulus lupulus]|uniref:uncharacterized protein LOC133795468 n=1 Tax=Humulus lupulus TaxID=3486 RepID=UPI002B411779|nr:uncharacterized protein LOC133795468 [Humulus lupulus]